MLKKILQIILISSATTFIYLGNTQLTSISILILIVLSFSIDNYFSFLSIIPLFFINKNEFTVFIILYISLFFIKRFVTKHYIKTLSELLLSSCLLLYELLINDIQIEIILICLLIITLAFSVKMLYKKIANQIIFDMLILGLSILNFTYINTYIFITIFFILMIIEGLSFNKYYFIITAFLITVYAIYKTDNYIYIILQLFAYLGYFINLLSKKNTTSNELEFILDDMNINISNFCYFLQMFSELSGGKDYEKRVSSSIKILIESNCLSCKNKTTCYTTKKNNTYLYLKGLLTKKDQINSMNEAGKLFECKNYFLMAEKALKLQQQYNLIHEDKIEDLKISGICSSIQNYFISLFEKMSPEVIKLMTYKRKLYDLNLSISDFKHIITDQNNFEFKIYSISYKDLTIIMDYSKTFFKDDVTISLREGYVLITPKRKFKLSYDFATLSLNNCNISGDNILFKYISEVDFICALSDGMGSGYYAYQLSQETLKMVDNITNCNISFNSALQILNTFFKTRDLSDSYATLDLVEINLCDGILNLYKLGSSTTYISRGEKIIPIYNNNLPFGINELITKEEYNIIDGDLIILVSDGINDYINEKTLINYIESLKNELPHKIVYEILQKIYHENSNQIKDDMSCIAIKIKQNINSN